MELFNFDPATIFSFWLTLMRVSLVLFVLPFFGGKSVPKPVKAALCIVLALALWPHLSFSGVNLPANGWAIAVMLLGELTLGLILNLVVRFLFAAVQTAGAIMGFQMGFAMINIVDPLTGISEPVTSHFLYMVTLLTFLVLNGHLFLLKGLAGTFDMIPPGSLYITEDLGTRIMELGGTIYYLAVKIAAPVTIAIILVDLSLALISRVAPQMHLLVLGFPLKIGVGMIILGMIFTYLARYVGEFIASLGPVFHTVLSLAVKPAGG